ncbi:MAG: DoxX family protein [Solirubrobacterales bacterium]
MHFVRPRDYAAIMPPYVPMHREAVVVSGAAEIIGGLAVIPPATRGFGRWWMLALLVAVFPANVYTATNPADVAMRGVPADRIPAWMLWGRLPLQPLMMWWVWAATRSNPSAGRRAGGRGRRTRW